MFITDKFPGRRFDSIEELEKLEAGRKMARESLRHLGDALEVSYVVDIAVVVDKPATTDSEFPNGKAQEKEQVVDQQGPCSENSLLQKEEEGR